jgi:trimeric autotransporter adhesin
MKKKYCSLLLLSLFSLSVSAQNSRNNKIANEGTETLRAGFPDLTPSYLKKITSSSSRSVFFSENFDAATIPNLPDGWKTYSDGADSDLFLVADQSTSNQGGFFPITASSKFALTDDDMCNCDKSKDYLQTPAIDLSAASAPQLSFNYILDDQYEGEASVEISTDGNQWVSIKSLVATNSTYAWQESAINLSAYAGQSSVFIRFVFDDEGDWSTGLAIDDVTIAQAPSTEIKMVRALRTYSEYFSMPVKQAPAINFSGRIANTGADAIPSAQVTANVSSLTTSANAFSGSGNSGALNSGDTAVVNVSGSFTPVTSSWYGARIEVSANGDGNAANNWDSLYINISDSVMARENASNLFYLPTGTSKIAQVFDVFKAGKVTSTWFALYRPKMGDTLSLDLVKLENGKPGGEKVATTIKYVTVGADTLQSGVLVKALPFENNSGLFSGVCLTPGRYALVFNPGANDPQPLISGSAHTPNTTFITDSTNQWVDLGAYTYLLRLNFGDTCQDVTSIENLVVSNIVNIYPNPSSGIINLQLNSQEKASVVIYNSLGAIINQVDADGSVSKLTFDLSAQPNGVYFVRFSSASGTAVKKVSINR